jgi:hypothetical protein
MERQMKKTKMSVADLRRAYLEKVEEHVHSGVDRNVMDRIWDNLIASSGWTFLDTMEFIQNSSSSSGDAKISVFLSEYMSRVNLPWKYWFFEEFPEQVKDMRMDWSNNNIPYPWLQASIDRIVKDKRLQHQDDALFIHVPWRSCYMWTRAFVRICHKYYADYSLRWEDMSQRTNLKVRMIAGTGLGRRSKNVPRIPPLSEARKSVVFVQKGGHTYAEVDTLTPESNFRVMDRLPVEVLFARRYGPHIRWLEHWSTNTSIMLKAYMAFHTWIQELRSTEEEALRVQQEYHNKRPAFLNEWPNIGKDGEDVAQGRFEYNFTPATVDAFIRWYVTRTKTLRITIVFNSGGSTALGNDLVFSMSDEIVDPQPNMGGRLVRVTLEEGNVVHKFVEIDPETQKEHWPLLEQLPLCPRRIDTQDPEQRAVQFLGKQIE